MPRWVEDGCHCRVRTKYDSACRRGAYAGTRIPLNNYKRIPRHVAAATNESREVILLPKLVGFLKRAAGERHYKADHISEHSLGVCM